MLPIRPSPPLCPGVVLESLEPEFRRFHAGRSELHAKKGAGVLFGRTFFVAGSAELGACVFEKQRLRDFDRPIAEIRLIKPSIFIMILPSKCHLGRRGVSLLFSFSTFIFLLSTPPAQLPTRERWLMAVRRGC